MKGIGKALRRNPSCCLSLRSGTLILGSFEVFVYGLGLLLYVTLLGNAIFLYNDDLPAFLDAMIDEEGIMTAENGTEIILLDDDPASKVNYIFISLAIKTVVFFARLMVAIILIIGVHKSSSRLLRSWIGVQMACLLINAVLLIVYMIALDTVNIAWAGSSIIISLYCMFLVRSFIDSIERESSKSLEMKKTEKPPL